MKKQTVAVTANYSDTGLSEYKGNPLIEALPQICQDDIALAKALSSRPNHSIEELKLHPRLRMHAVARLLNGEFFYPLPSHLSLEKKLSLMTRSGYIKRNPATNDDKRLIQENYLKTQGIDSRVEIFPTTDRAVQSTTLIGCSGSGKTTAVRKVLSTYPQLIEHPDHKMHQQLTYVIVECPYNGDLSNLCSNFFHSIDEVLGTTYHRRYVQQIRVGEKTLLQAMTQIAIDHSLGLLVIDEIQHLQDTKTKRDELLNFFTELTNTIGIPILLVGTPKASGISKDLRGARREIGFGSMEWGISKTEKDMKNWRNFVKGLWRFQWVQNQTEQPSQEVVEHLFSLSQGIIDITIKIFVIAQIRAIVSKVEELTVPLFDTVYEEEMKSVHPMLDALRSGNQHEIERYSDLSTPKVDIEDIVSQVPQDVEPQEDMTRSSPEDAELKLLLGVFKLKFSDHVTQIAQLQEEYPDIDNPELVRKLITEIDADNQSIEKLKSKEKQTKTNVIPISKWSQLNHDDLRYIHSQSTTESEMHRNLKKAGIIVSLD